MIIEFDGQNRIIYIDNVIDTINIKSIYSRWKDWVLVDLNAMYFQAFACENIDNEIQYYLTNDWKIRQKNNNQVLNIIGNLIIDKK